MSRRCRISILSVVFMALLVCATSIILASRASTKPPPIANELVVQSKVRQNLRNLSLQPEVASVNRRLGNRFKTGRAQSVLAANLIINGELRNATIVRRQRETGETVEVVLANRRLSWSDTEGIKANQDAATEAERLMVERLVLDSPDHFVLAQLQGASYQTIFLNLRPTDAGEDYSGPIWTVVRVTDPQNSEGSASKTSWRLYYINAHTGLIDRVDCEIDGQRFEATIVQWAEQNGERIPSHMKWTTNGQTLMEYQLTSFIHGP